MIFGHSNFELSYLSNFHIYGEFSLYRIDVTFLISLKRSLTNRENHYFRFSIVIGAPLQATIFLITIIIALVIFLIFIMLHIFLV